MKSPEEIKEVLKPLNGSGLYHWVAGDAITSFFLGRNISDLHVYFTSGKERLLAEGYLFSKGYKVIKRNNLGCKMRKANSIIDVLFSKKTPEETLYKFDYTVFCAAIDSEGKFYCHERFFEDMEDKNLYYTGNHQSIGAYSFKSKSNNLQRFINKGFGIKDEKNLLFWLKRLTLDQEQIKQNKVPKIKQFKILKMS